MTYFKISGEYKIYFNGKLTPLRNILNDNTIITGNCERGTYPDIAQSSQNKHLPLQIYRVKEPANLYWLVLTNPLESQPNEPLVIFYMDKTEKYFLIVEKNNYQIVKK